jgi:hypothetical protein
VPDTLSDAISGRLDAIYQSITADALPDSWWKRLFTSAYLKLGWSFAKSVLRHKALEVIRQGLQDQKLLAEDQQ